MNVPDFVVGLVRSSIRCLDLVFYPPHCLISGEAITQPSPLPGVSAEWLDLCDPAPSGTELLLTAQRHLAADDIAFSSVTALWALTNNSPAHALMMAIKYGGHSNLAVAMGKMLGAFAQCEMQNLVTPINHQHVCFVAVHRLRNRERGYDQAQCIATGVSMATRIPLLSALVRTRYTGTQTSLNDEQRAKNVEGAFSATHHAELKDASVLLVDDVFTTGATVNAGASALLEAGARRVDVLTLCATM